MLFSSKLPFAYSDTANMEGRTENGEQKPPSSPHAVKNTLFIPFFIHSLIAAREAFKA